MLLRRFAMVLVLAAAMPAAAATVTITRDAWGVPHVFVPDSIGNRVTQLKALGFAQGYATASDRMVQLEFFRRAAKGRLSEIAFLGPSYLPGDIVTRRDGLTDDERRLAVRRLPGKLRISFEAFRDGVNQFLADAAADPAKKPIEFILLGLNPEPWDITDTAAIAELQIRRFGQNGGGELDNAALLLDLLDHFASSDAQGIFDDLIWRRDPTAPTTISPAEQTFATDSIAPFAQQPLVQQYANAIRNATMARRDEQTMLASVGRAAGWPWEFPATASNAMVVSGALTASGAPILLGGPQTGMALPSFFYQVGLHGGGYDADGVTVPAGTGLVIGRTRNAAWTLTSGITDNTDVYIEVLHPGNPHQYLFNGKYRDMSCRIEVFTPAGQPSQNVELCRTVHGPVFASYPADGVAFSSKLHFFGREVEIAANLVSLGFTRNLSQFKRVANRLEASLNLMYADNAGNIGYFHRGVLPQRPSTIDPRLPLPGTGEAEVNLLLRGKRMPTAVNPPLGYVAQWNNKPIQGWPSDDQRELWGGADRVQVLIDQLEAAKTAHHQITTADVKQYMETAATVDIFAPRVSPYLRAAVDALPPATPDLAQLDAAADLVDAWIDAGAPLRSFGGATIPYPGVTIYRRWREAMQTATFGDELGPQNRGLDYATVRVSDNADDGGSLFSPDALFLRALAWPTAAFPTSRDYFEDVVTQTNPGRDVTIVTALRTTIADLTADFGTADPAQWLMPKITVQFESQSAAPFLYGPTVIEREDRGTMNHVHELLPTLASEIVVPPGNSGHIPSNAALPEPAHLRDQLALYEGFGWHSLPMDVAALEGPTTSETLTLP